MAVATSERARKKLDDELNCSVCLDRYTDPRTLPCHHSFCKDCIDRLPVELTNGRHEIKCPLCKSSIPVPDDVFPPAFHINNLMEIAELLAPVNEPIPTCHAHKKQKDLFCETCDELICLDCTKGHHMNHQYNNAADLYDKHKCEIQACLEPLKERTDEVDEVLQEYITREREIQDMGRSVKAEIDSSVERLFEKLRQLKKSLSGEVDNTISEKLQLHRCQKEQVEVVCAQLKSCHKFVEEEVRMQSRHQMQAAKGRLIERINNTYKKVKVRELKPAQVADIVFVENQDSALSALSLGKMHSILCYSAPGIFTVNVPDLVMARQFSELVISSSFPFLSKRLTCQLFYAHAEKSLPVLCRITASSALQCTFSFQPLQSGQHLLRVQMDGHDIHGSPYRVYVCSIPEVRDQRLKVFAEGLDTPSGITVSEDGKLVLVAEWNGRSVQVFSSGGEKIRRVSAKFNKPWGVASFDDHIFVCDASMLQKLTSAGVFVKSIKTSTYGIAINRQSGMVYFVDWDEKTITAVNSELEVIQTFGRNLKNPRDIAIDNSGKVYVTDYFHRKIFKFTADGRFLYHIGGPRGEKNCYFSQPHGICIDSNDILYITDRKDNCVMVFTTGGVFLGSFGSTRLQPRGIAVDRTGNLYVCDNTGKVFVSKMSS